MLDFTNQVVLVTGAGSAKGMGRVIAQTFGKQGAKVVICDINQAGCDANVKEMKEMGIEAEGFAANLTDPEAVNELVNTIVDKYGRIDVLVNNAGISQKVTVADMTLDDIKRIFNVNMFGLFLITQAVCEVMKKQHYGRIVHLSSVSGKRGGGIFGGAHYSASKAAVLGFSKNLAREVFLWYHNKLRMPWSDQYRDLEITSEGTGRRCYRWNPDGTSWRATGSC